MLILDILDPAATQARPLAAQSRGLISCVILSYTTKIGEKQKPEIDDETARFLFDAKKHGKSLLVIK